MNINIDQVCQDLYDGTNFPGVWHGYDWWGKASDFHEHPSLIWNTIQQIFDVSKPLQIVEVGRCSGSSTMLFSTIAQHTGGYFKSFDISDWNRNHIESINQKYGINNKYYNYIVDDSLNAEKHLDPNVKIDILFLDGLHSYEQIKNETLLFSKFLNKTSLVLFHDTVWAFDAVMGWIHDYLANSNVTYCKHTLTSHPQCKYCERFNKPGLMHGRPTMSPNGRPNFQSPYDKIEESPHFNTLTDAFLRWGEVSFEEAIQRKLPLVFTNIEACCGMGMLVTHG